MGEWKRDELIQEYGAACQRVWTLAAQVRETATDWLCEGPDAENLEALLDAEDRLVKILADDFGLKPGEKWKK